MGACPLLQTQQEPEQTEIVFISSWGKRWQNLQNTRRGWASLIPKGKVCAEGHLMLKIKDNICGDNMGRNGKKARVRKSGNINILKPAQRGLAPLCHTKIRITLPRAQVLIYLWNFSWVLQQRCSEASHKALPHFLPFYLSQSASPGLASLLFFE